MPIPGKLKKRMYLAHLRHTDNPQPGDELFSADMEGQASRHDRHTAPVPSGAMTCWRWCRLPALESHTLHWESLQGAALHFLRSHIPYPKANRISASDWVRLGRIN